MRNSTIHINIEVCQNCEKHNWFSQHTEERYINYFNKSNKHIFIYFLKFSIHKIKFILMFFQSKDINRIREC